MSASETTTSPSDFPALVGRLRDAFRTGRTWPAEWRRRQLKRLRKLTVEKEPEILQALHSDLGKSSFEGWIAELNLVVAEIDHALSHLSAWMKPQKVSTPMILQPATCKIYPEPLGVTLIVGPWNYPYQLAVAPLVAAIAAGNCAVVKPSELAPATSSLLAKLLSEALDDACFAVVEGGVEASTGLLEQRFDHIFFTGSTQIGRIVMRAAAEHLTPVTLELGGKSPCIIDKSVSMDVACRRIVWGKFFNAGQTCVAPDYLLVHETVLEPVLKGLSGCISDFFGDDPRKSADYARIVSDHHFQRLSSLITGGKVVTGGELVAGERYIAPTILQDVDLASPLMSEEIFGPLLPVLPVSSISAAVEFINDRPKPLALYVFSDDKEALDYVLRETSSGGACTNDVVAHLSVPDLPFGGVGPSGMGAYHGKAGFDAFSHRKSVLHKSTYLDVALRYPPYNEKKAKWARRIM